MSATEVLPIEAIQSEFCKKITLHNMVVLSAPPGAGKSTCLPLWLLSLAELSEQKIYLLQPRRLAVKNIATYLAEQLNEKVGDTVGYRLRNDTKVSATTRLEVITEGILTQIIQNDEELSNCGLVVFDEFHERSIHGDLAFALTRDIQQGLRDDLKILLMSATLDIDYLVNALPDASVLSSEGRSFPIEYRYQAPANIQRWREHAINVIKHQALKHSGSILVFLPGVADIRFIEQAVKQYCPEDLLLCPLYGDLSLNQQQQAISPCSGDKRKLVLATNIAETSLTIEGVSMVIDCGFEKVAIYDNASLMNKLSQQQIAKSSAIQRAGRAGRLMAGHCIRLYSKDDFERRPEQGHHDIQQVDLLPTLIEVARWGVTSLSKLPLLELPSAHKEKQAWQELQSLSIVNTDNKLTKHGEGVSKLPCHPRFGHMLLKARGFNDETTLLACMITALLEDKDILPKEHAYSNANLTHRLELLAAGWHKPRGSLINIIKQVKALLKNFQLEHHKILSLLNKLPINTTGLLLAYAYPERVAIARKSSGDYVCANGKGVSISEQDALSGSQFLVIADLIQIKNSLKVRLAANIDLSQIEEAFAEKINSKELAKLDEASGKIIVRQQRVLASLVLEESISKNVLSADHIRAMWCDYILQKGLNSLSWQVRDNKLKARWQWLNTHFPDYDLPILSDEFLLGNLPLWFSPFVGEIKSKTQLNRLDLSSMLMTMLDYQQQQIIKQAAPNYYEGPTGRQCPITYGVEKSPKVSLPMQEVYGLHKTPMVGNISNSQEPSNTGVPLVLELLSPAQRPIQVTQDLSQFWQGSYKAVQKDMKSRYPKHYWPDDPANAKATNKTKRHIQGVTTSKN